MGGASYDNYASFWLAETAYYYFYRLGALPLIIFAHALVVTSAYGVTLWLCYRCTGSWRLASAGTLFAVALGVDNWNVRPQAVGYLLFSLCAWSIWVNRRRAMRWLLAVPPISITLWANCHGSFFLGFVLLGIWFAEAVVVDWYAALRSRSGGGFRVLPAFVRAKIPALLLAASLAGAMLNPRGLRVVSYVGSISGNAVIRGLVGEWRPPGFDSLNGVIFISALLSVAVLFAISPRRPGFFALLIFVVFALIGLSSSRSVVWFGLALAPFVAEHVGETVAQLRRVVVFRSATVRTQDRVRRDTTGLNCVICALVIVGVALSLPWFKHLLPLPEAKAGLVSVDTPVEAVRVLKAQHLPREVFHDEGTGSYLTWAAPEYPVFVDTRFELYPPKLWHDYLRVSAAETGWEWRLESHGIKTLLLNRESQGSLIAAAQTSAQWRVAWEDTAFVLLSHR